jgi:peptidyl-prolyl cis-trans isomerase SurA
MSRALLQWLGAGRSEGPAAALMAAAALALAAVGCASGRGGPGRQPAEPTAASEAGAAAEPPRTARAPEAAAQPPPEAPAAPPGQEPRPAEAASAAEAAKPPAPQAAPPQAAPAQAEPRQPGRPATSGVAPGGGAVLDRVAAIVNSEVITLSEVDAQLPPGRPITPEARREALDRLIEATLVLQEATRSRVAATEAEIDQEIAAVRERERLSEEELARALAAEGLTLPEYRARLAENIRRAKLIARSVRGEVTVPEATLRAHYEANKAQFTPPAQVRVRLLLLPVPAGATEAERAATRAEAQAIRLRAVGGEPFEGLVRRYSKGPAAAEGGDLGGMQTSQLDPRFEAALRDLKPGQVSSPVTLESGIALLQLVERQGGEPEPFEAVRDRIYRQLYDREFEQALQQWLQRLRAKAAIEVRP